jgi:predicted transcriptional regulator
MSATSVRLQPDVESALEATSAQLGRSKGWVINEALREYIARQDQAQQRWAQTLGALDAVARGEVVDGASVHDWLRGWGGDAETDGPDRAR